MPGSKNGIVTLTDAIKYNLPKEAPFPAGLRSSEVSVGTEGNATQVSEDTIDETPNNEGADVEN